ncbi:HAMP domain-containing sensor histidine kinase [Clostridium sp. UBA1056]|uniref:HAMP domain-containing sensor histidine kinase n=1 Tax=unclassified Clostridium TaxID=2614128 RepID=UPI003216BB7C
MRNFINPELKKSSMVLMVAIIIFIAIVNIGITFSFNSIKNQYIDGRAAMVATVMEKYPGMEVDLIEAAFKVPAKEEIETGERILKKYGYNDNLNIIYLNGINEAFKSSRFILILIGITFGALLMFLNYLQYSGIYSRVRNLTKASKEILEENYDVNIYEEKEGDFAKLSYGFKNMRQVLQSQMIDLKKEKEFLVNILSDISHQLKTPLSALIVYNDILSKKGISEDNRKKFLDSSKVQLNRMDWLIKSMLKLAKVDAKAINFNIKQNSLINTIYEVMDNLAVMAAESKVNISFKNSIYEEDFTSNKSLADKTNKKVNKKFMFNYDEQWLGEALINIVKNGIEHSEGGEIYIHLEENPINTKIIIRDSGEGINEKDLPNIFKRFYKGGKSDSVGIGLSLSKSIIEAQGGYVEVRSNVGVGTEFKVVLMRNI